MDKALVPAVCPPRRFNNYMWRHQVRHLPQAFRCPKGYWAQWLQYEYLETTGVLIIAYIVIKVMADFLYFESRLMDNKTK